MNDTLVKSTIVETLVRNGALEAKALFKRVKKLHGNIDTRFFDRTLMTMELHGLVRVSQAGVFFADLNVFLHSSKHAEFRFNGDSAFVSAVRISPLRKSTMRSA